MKNDNIINRKKFIIIIAIILFATIITTYIILHSNTNNSIDTSNFSDEEVETDEEDGWTRYTVENIKYQVPSNWFSTRSRRRKLSLSK